MKAILLLHGFLTDPLDFDFIMEDLLNRYDYVCPLVFPGHGIERDFENFHVNETFDLTLRTFDELALKYETVDVMGYSMGGAIATYLSNVRNFNKLILLAPANKFFNWKMPFSVLASFLKSHKRKDFEEYDFKDRTRIDSIRALNIALTELIPSYTVHNLTTFIRVINKCNKYCKEIKNPVLILWGVLDEFVPRSSIEFNYKLCTNKYKKKVIYDDMSHLMLRSIYPAEIANEILRFIDLKLE